MIKQLKNKILGILKPEIKKNESLFEKIEKIEESIDKLTELNLVTVKAVGKTNMKNDRLHKAIQKKNIENKGLEERVRTMEKTLEEHKNQIMQEKKKNQKLEEENEELQLSLEKVQRENVELGNQVSDLSERENTLQQQLTEKESVIDQKKLPLSNETKEEIDYPTNPSNSSINLKETELEQKILVLKKEIRERAGEFEEQLRVKEEKLQAINKELDESIKQTEDAVSKVESLQIGKGEMEKHINDLEKKVNHLRLELNKEQNSTDKKLETLNYDYNVLEAQTKELKGELESYKTQIEQTRRLEDENGQLLSKVNELITQRNEMLQVIVESRRNKVSTPSNKDEVQIIDVINKIKFFKSQHFQKSSEQILSAFLKAYKKPITERNKYSAHIKEILVTSLVNSSLNNNVENITKEVEHELHIEVDKQTKDNFLILLQEYHGIVSDLSKIDPPAEFFFIEPETDFDQSCQQEVPGSDEDGRVIYATFPGVITVGSEILIKADVYIRMSEDGVS